MGSILFTLVWTTFSTDYLYRPHSNSNIAFNLIFDITKQEPLGFNTCQYLLHTDPPTKTGLNKSLGGSCVPSGNLLLLRYYYWCVVPDGSFFTRILDGTHFSDFNFLPNLHLFSILRVYWCLPQALPQSFKARKEFLRRTRCLTSSSVENEKYFVEIIISGWIHRLRC